MSFESTINEMLDHGRKVAWTDSVPDPYRDSAHMFAMVERETTLEELALRLKRHHDLEAKRLMDCVKALMDIISDHLTAPKCLDGNSMTEECAFDFGKEFNGDRRCTPQNCPINPLRKAWFDAKAILAGGCK